MRFASAAVLAATLAGACGRPAPGPGDQNLSAQLGDIAAEFVRDKRPTGLAIGVIKEGRVVYSGGFGRTRVGGGDSVTARTIFHMASVTKPFVATAVLQLVERGLVDLDAPVRRYLPRFSIRGAGADSITVRRLLTHTAGIPDVTDYAWGRPEYDGGALSRWVDGLADSTLIGPPGAQWAYSNIGFEILAQLVATVTGEPFEDYVQARILTPLRMTKSTVLMTDVDSTLLAWGSEPDGGGGMRPTPAYPYNRRHAASSTLHSNVDDMLRWAQANLNRGTLDGAEILPRPAYDRLWRAERDMTEQIRARIEAGGGVLPFTSMHQALSWFVVVQNGHTLINHSGGDTGFRSDLLLAPDANAAVVVMTNSSADMVALSRQLMAAVLAPPG